MNTKPLPESVELVRDVSVARWVVDGLRSWGRAGVPVAAIVPERFEAYARVPHEGETEYGDDLPPEQLTALAGLLSRFTSTPESCWMCVWSGYGYWGSRSFKLLVTGSGRKSRIEKEFRRVMKMREKLIKRAPQVKTQGREYFLFHGPISAATSLDFTSVGDPQSPNLWWPDDRAWCVGTDIDLPTTFVGGSRACIDAVIGTAELDASEVGPDDDVNDRPTAGQ